VKANHVAAVRVIRSLALCGAVAALAACVPTGSAPPYDAGAAPTAAATFKPSLNVMSAAFEDNFDRPDAVDSGWPAFDTATPSPADGGREGGLALLNRDSGGLEGGPAASATAAEADSGPGFDGGLKVASIDRGNLGPNWVQIKTNAWRVEGGKLCVQNARNHGIWLNRTLPVNARIEFDATGFTDDGDLKTEVWGDGTSYATGTSYTNATSYLAVLGGWKNTLHVLARLNEHGSDRKEIRVDKDSDDPRQRPAQKGQTYHFKIERTDGKTVRWSVDGIDFLTWNDPAPLAGQGHDHFGFNEWEAKVCFDNVKVTPL
jgi:hypothetical protein